jgi:hypothetical protein
MDVIASAFSPLFINYIHIVIGILFVVFGILISITNAQVISYESNPEDFLGNKGLAIYLMKEYASEYGIDWRVMYDVVDCETGHTFDPSIQSTVTYKYDVPAWGVKKGDRELSYGLAQYHLPSHPEITVEQATNPRFAIRRMAEDIAQGRLRQWSCAR